MKQLSRPVSFLASVTSEAEARTCVALGADIIDAKDPAAGALGALPRTKVRAICESVSARVPVSATIGDLPPDPEIVSGAVLTTAATGVDFVKVGIWPGGDIRATLKELSKLSLGRVRLVGVLLADQGADVGLVMSLAEAGFRGVMFDTASKGSGALPDILSASELARFIDTAHDSGMFAGLAGSLRVQHVTELLKLGADLLGFRGGLCGEGQRCGRIDAAAVREVRDVIPQAALMLGQPCFGVGDGGIPPTGLERTY